MTAAPTVPAYGAKMAAAGSHPQPRVPPRPALSAPLCLSPRPCRAAAAVSAKRLLGGSRPPRLKNITKKTVIDYEKRAFWLYQAENLCTRSKIHQRMRFSRQNLFISSKINRKLRKTFAGPKFFAEKFGRTNFSGVKKSKIANRLKRVLPKFHADWSSVWMVNGRSKNFFFMVFESLNFSL